MKLAKFQRPISHDCTKPQRLSRELRGSSVVLVADLSVVRTLSKEPICLEVHPRGTTRLGLPDPVLQSGECDPAKFCRYVDECGSQRQVNSTDFGFWTLPSRLKSSYSNSRAQIKPQSFLNVHFADAKVVIFAYGVAVSVV